MNGLKRIFHVNSTLQLVVVFLVFSLTGSAAVLVAHPLMDVAGITRDVLPPLAFWPLRIAIVFIAYQVMLVAIGALFGQGPYFWAMEKRILRRLGIRLN